MQGLTQTIKQTNIKACFFIKVDFKQAVFYIQKIN